MNGFCTFVLFSVLYINVCAQSAYVATIHPLQQIVRELMGPDTRVDDLLPPGVSPHTFEPSPADVQHIASAAVLFLVGPNLDEWVKQFPARHTVELLDLLPADSLIFFEKFQGGNRRTAHEQAISPIHHHQGVDPHFWTDPLLVQALLPALAETLARENPSRRDLITANRIRFSGELTGLDRQIRDLLGPYQGKAVVQSHPFFNYYLRRYGLRTGGIVEVNPGVDPTARQIKNLTDEIERENISVILTQPQLPDRAARLIAEITRIPVVELDPLGGDPGRQTYSEILMYNTRLIAGALQ